MWTYNEVLRKCIFFDMDIVIARSQCIRLMRFEKPYTGETQWNSKSILLASFLLNGYV